jgi:hypothetical protein
VDIANFRKITSQQHTSIAQVQLADPNDNIFVAILDGKPIAV